MSTDEAVGDTGAANQAEDLPKELVISPKELENKPSGKIHGSLIPHSMYADGETRWAVVQEGRVFRIFMSSTFRDMQKERDEFFTNAEKKLKDFATKKGFILVFIDLRWGLTNEISENGFVVISCLEAIEECPYFLCTLGSRYGWSPNHESPSEWHPSTDLRFPYLKEIRGLSVTDYEIIHGALRENAVARRAFFYSRDEEYAIANVAENDAERELYRPVNQEDKEKQDGLKNKIGHKFEIKPYKTPKELVTMMVDELMDAMNQDFPEQLSKNSEDIAHEQFMRHRLIGLEGRDSILSVLKNKAAKQLSNDYSKITIVGAESGIGKSTIMSGLVRDLNAEKDPNMIVIYHFVGCSNLSNYVENLVERVTRALQEKGLVDLDTFSEDEKDISKKGLDEVLKLASMHSTKKIVLVVDAFNQLVDSQQYPHVHRLEWLPKRTPKNVSIVASTIDTHESCKVAKSFGLDVVPVSKLDAEGIRQATISFFKRYNKTLNERQMEMILDDHADTGHPLYLRIVLDELRVFGVYERVDLELYEMLETKGVISLFNLVMSRWEGKYGDDIVRLSICVLYVSRIGLNENELDKYMAHRFTKADKPMNHVAWKSFLFVLLDSLFVRNGRYAFSHQLLTQSIHERYFEDKKFMESEAREYGLWMLDEYPAETADKSVVAEICHNLRISREFGKLSAFLKNHKVIENLLDGNYRFEFFECWRDLNKNGYDHKTVYGEMVKELNPAGSALVDYFQEIQENEFLVPILEYRISVETDEGSNSRNLNFLGRVYDELGKHEQALGCHQKSLEIRSKVYGEMHPIVSASYNNIGLVYSNIGKHQQALVHYQRSLEIQRAVFGEIHPVVATSYNNIGLVFDDLGQKDEALEYSQRSLEIRLKVFGETHPSVAGSLNNIGDLHESRMEYYEALEMFEKASDIFETVYGLSHPHTTDARKRVTQVKNKIKNPKWKKSNEKTRRKAACSIQ